MTVRCAIRLAVAAVLSLAAAATAQAQSALTVYAAASLTNALQDAGPLFTARSGTPVRFSFAASSALARQIEQGAPADVFASADEKWMDYLAERKLIVAETRSSPLRNRLVMIAPADRARPVTVDRGLDLAALLGPDGRIAVGDPAHVPAGRYAQQALTSLGLWTAAEPRLARADNVRSALAFVERGEAPIGIVYATDAVVAAKATVVGMFPADSHAPIAYPVAAVAGRDGPGVRAFLAFLVSPEVQPVFAKYGFGRSE